MVADEAIDVTLITPFGDAGGGSELVIMAGEGPVARRLRTATVPR